MDRAQKEALVTNFNGVFKDAGVVVVAHYAGLTVAQMTDLRRRMKDAGGQVKVAKNRLLKLALQGTPAQGIPELFKGQTMIAFSKDPMAAVRVAVKYSKENDKLVLLGGSMGATTLDPKGLKTLADLPSLDQLRATLVGLIQAPATKIARILNEPGAMLARVIKAKADAGQKAA
ncbi:MAG: 50S ribosomal protein L10 [Hyphomicrobiaceae bacterium]|nr:MAG: 50S ribosomal protein L10 [Hyphomicrobiaceae bacterium]